MKKKSSSLFDKMEPQKRELLDKYADLVVRYNSIFDLTNAKDKDDFIENHIEDALLALDEIRKLVPEGSDTIYDLGSGCGVPGIPLAICMEDKQAVLVERGSRRADFLSLCVASLGLSKRIHVAKIDIGEIYDRIGFAVSRAVGQFEEMEERLYDSLSHGGTLVMYKGRLDKTEKTSFSFFKNIDVVRLDAKNKERCLLVLRK